MVGKKWAKPALQTEQQNKNQTRYYRRNRKRQIDQCGQNAFTSEFKFGYRPCGRYAENKVQRHSHSCGKQGQADRRQSIGIFE